MTEVTFTHKGWFGICPVYFAGLETEAPAIDPRHWTLTPLMIVMEGFYWIAFRLREAIDPAFEPAWPLVVTGELAAPIIRRG